MIYNITTTCETANLIDKSLSYYFSNLLTNGYHNKGNINTKSNTISKYSQTIKDYNFSIDTIDTSKYVLPYSKRIGIINYNSTQNISPITFAPTYPIRIYE